MKKKHLAELVENLESRVRFMEARITKLEMESFRINPVSPVSPISPTVPPPANDHIKCHKCGLSGMSSFVCTRNDCPAKVTVTCSVPNVPDTHNHALDDLK